jgi:cell division protein FtsL
VTATALAPARARGTARVLTPWAAPTSTRPFRARPQLREVAIPARTIRRRRRTMALAASVTVIAILTAVVFHALLAQSQITIDQLGQRESAAERRYQDARLERARLTAPQRIVERALQAGLVLPDRPPTAVPVTGELPPEPDAPADDLHGWTNVKPTLGSQP